MARKKKSKRRKKKSEWRTDPITGMRYRKDSIMGMMDDYSPPEFDMPRIDHPKRRRKKTRKTGYYDIPESGLDDLPWPLQLFIGIFIMGAIMWAFWGEAITGWWNTWKWIILLIIVVVSGGIIYYFIQKSKRKKEFENEQTSKGLVKFVDSSGKEKWGTSNQVKKWREEDNLMNKLVKEIKEFEPPREKLGLEYNYQLALHGWLKRSFPSAKIERQKGSARPDIIIQNIAIELKGPTTSGGLDTIASKAMRYRQHYDAFIVVLFETKVSHKYYEDWLKGMKEQYPKAVIIKKS